MALLRSMTGFARVRRLSEHGEMIVTLKGVNHRSLDVHLHLPADLDAYGNTLRNAVKRKCSRGHVDLRVSWNRAGTSTLLSLNRPLFESWLSAFEAARGYHKVFADPDLNSAMRIPGMLSEIDAEPDEALEGFLSGLTEEALDAFNESRAKEGTGLGAAIREINSHIREHAVEMAGLREKALPAFQERLHERLSNLLTGNNIDPQRVVQEAAILADRSDITEEIHRLTIHSKHLDELLDAGGDIGKKLDFLMQEMGRETNTILSKTGGAGEIGLRLTDLGIAVKSEIERIREQSLNLE